MNNEEDDDYDVDDILDRIESSKKRKNSKQKGKRGELGLVKLLNTRFNTGRFSRVVGSGNRPGQIRFASKDYIGDLVCPEGFRFSVECKSGYEHIDLFKALDGGSKAFDDFLNQATKDAKLVDKEPLLCWKRDRMPWLAALQVDDTFPYYMSYRDWRIVSFNTLLTFPDKFFWVSA